MCYQQLHEAVGIAVLAAPGLPTQAAKRPHLEYGLGGAVKRLKDRYGSDYALFVHTKATYSSGGRIVLGLITAVGGISLSQGTQIGFASLVDLDDGKVIWFRHPLTEGTWFNNADGRTSDGAVVLAEALLEGLPL